MTTAHDHLAHFDGLYARDADPWDYEGSRAEAHKRATVLASLGSGSLGRVCELGCGPGVATVAMAPRCARLLAIDGSREAAALAHARTAHLRRVRVHREALPPSLPTAAFDAIVATEVLYYLPRPVRRATLTAVSRALRPGGHFVSTNSLERFGDAEVANAALIREQQAAFGAPVRTVVGAGWRLDAYRLARPTLRREVVSPLGFEPRTY